MESKSWNLTPAHPQAQELAGRLKASPVLAQALLNRGLDDPDACRRFLQPNPRDLHDPSLLPNLPHAAQRIAQAIRDKQKIVIYGDYDVDGITATAILWHAIHCLGGRAEFYIPHRLEEGYGLNSQAIGQIIDRGANLIITVDCGITAIEPAAVARERGVDLIISDHHEWREAAADGADSHSASSTPRLPDCFAVVHPRLPTSADPYPNPHLCGAGVAFKLAWGVGQAMSGQSRVDEAFRRFLIDATALAALGTIADVVPLIGENRTLASFGLSGLKQSTLTGLQALIDSAGLNGESLDSYHVGFRLAPRLNACGRMGHAQLAVEMLTKADATRAREIADYLERQNRQRQLVERKILDQALAQIEAQALDDNSRALVLGGEGWHPGVIGIVASRIVDRFHRPTVMVAFNEGIGQGSARSVAGFHLAKALDACDEYLEAHGGHEMAAGLRVASDRFEAFREAFRDYALHTVTNDMLVPRLNLELSAALSQITLPMVSDLKRLGPFGHANPRPLLCCAGLTLAGPPRRVGKSGDHLQLLVRQGDTTMKCIAFNAGQWFDRLQSGVQLDIAAEATLNHYNGRTGVELEVKDLRLIES